MSSASNSKQGRWLGDAATTSLELALVMVPFLWLLLGTIDLARYFFVVQSVVGLMSEAGRESLMDQSWQPCGINSWSNISTIAPLLDADNVNLCVIQGQSGYGVNNVYVTVTYPFTAMTPGLARLDGTISESTTYTY